MKQIKCANCGRTQPVEKMAESQARLLTPFERRRQRWFYVEKLDVVLCGGSLREDGIDDGRDWCLHMHQENNKQRWGTDVVLDIFLPGLNGQVPEGVEKHLEEVDGSEDPGDGD
jgi:hypothetical protein